MKPHGHSLGQYQDWQGRDGVATLFAASIDRIVPADPDSFLAQQRAVRTNEIQVSEWTLPSMVGLEPALSADAHVYRLDIIRAGQVQYKLRNQTHTAAAGTAHFLSCSTPTPFRTADGSRVLRVQMTGLPLPAPQLAELEGATGPLPPSRLLTALVLLAEEMLDACSVRTLSLTAQALQDLLRVLVGELSSPPALTLREELCAYIDQHLSDPSLGPTTIADAFGISLRWTHRTFNDGTTTVTQYIRQRRCEASAARLRLCRTRTDLDVLAADLGFKNRASLARAFRTHYDMSIGEYLHRFLHDAGVASSPADQASRSRAVDDLR